MSADHPSSATVGRLFPALAASVHPFPARAAASCALPALAAAGYALPALAGAGYAAPMFAGASAKLRGLLAIEDRTADGRGCALTFDDGPHRRGTPAVLEILAAAGVSATFFLVGEQVRANPSLAQEIAAAGHTLGLHCDRHRNLLRLAPWQVREDIARAEESIHTATGHKIALYRPPYGIANAAALRIARRRCWRTLLWSHWGRDWEQQATPDSIAALLTVGAGPGSVLLLHDADDYSAPGSWRNTVAALPRVLDELQQRGLAFTAP
ncbi:MAG TPA: polysaccharide deacetylase family protein [Solirubrobacteraceae bacterium]|jgi:peptidoglycan/xylan/chitin deacetylase (PgdA/CDA1 family)